MRDKLVLGDGLQFEWVWSGPEPTSFEVSFRCESGGELRQLIAACGAGEFWRRFKAGSSEAVLWAQAQTVGGRVARVWVHLRGEDFAPPEPAPAPLLNQLRQEAGLGAIDAAIEAADLDLAGRDRPADAGSADSVALVEVDRLEAADAI